MEIRRIGKLFILKLKEWGNARLLVDTGSTSPVIGRRLATKMGWLQKAGGRALVKWPCCGIRRNIKYKLI